MIFCDGTWNSRNLISTNVFRLYTLVNEMQNPNFITQYYDGVGTSSCSLLGDVLDGVYAESLERNIKQIYNCIVENYQKGDEISLFGFSRGAYTVRCVVGMIHNSGLVPDIRWTNEAYRRYRSRDSRDSPNSDESLRFKRKLECRDVKIKFLGLWDTVGAAGIPIDTQDGLEYMGFYDNVVSNIVENVSHAVAIHEHMACFEPCRVLKKNDNKITKITELWFPGEHLDVGGAACLGFSDISDMTLSWMIDQIGLNPPRLPGEPGGFIDQIIRRVHPLFDYALGWVSLRAPVVRDRRITDYDVSAIYNGGDWGLLTTVVLNQRYKSQTYNEFCRYMWRIRGNTMPTFIP
jgi:uncharacterized protein (DUF2235 family)